MNAVTEPGKTPAYELESVSRSYGGGSAAVEAVTDVTLRIDQGEYVVIAGPSGSGKTTLLQLLGALDRPSRGTIRFFGKKMNEMKDGQLTDLRSHSIGFVFQTFNLIPTLTAAQNVEAALAAAGVKSALATKRARDLLMSVGLGARATHLPGQLSGGEQQRVAIARALANEPRVILADEPTGNLDTKTGREVMSVLRSLAEIYGQTVILITHDPRIAGKAPRLIQMHDGRLIEDPTRENALIVDRAAGNN